MTGLRYYNTHTKLEGKKKRVTTRIRRRLSPPGTGSGTAPGLPISPCWPPVDKTRVSLSATFLQNRPPTTDCTFCAHRGGSLEPQPNFAQVRKIVAESNISRPSEKFVCWEVASFFRLLAEYCRITVCCVHVVLDLHVARSSSLFAFRHLRDFTPLATRRQVSREDKRCHRSWGGETTQTEISAAF